MRMVVRIAMRLDLCLHTCEYNQAAENRYNEVACVVITRLFCYHRLVDFEDMCLYAKGR